MKLTENELTICRATGAKWVTRDNTPIGFVCLYISEEQPPQSTRGDYVGTGKLGVLDARVFPSLERGECVKVVLSQQEKEKNEPLTLEELNNMDGQPVWITPGGFWALVYAREGERTILVSNDREGVFADKEIELVGPVYRRPPEEGQT